MKLISLSVFVFFLICSSVLSAKVVIGHRGASGYLPEHTIPALVMAHSFDIDYLEPDLVLSKDNKLVVLHDIYLDTVSDVKKRFPDRKRKDGRYYAIDFTLAELKQLNVFERIKLKTGKNVFPNRFSSENKFFKLASFEEWLITHRQLNRLRNKNIGIYPELKHPAFHKRNSKDIVKAFFDFISKYEDYLQGKKIILQCFDPKFLEMIRKVYKPSFPLVQLVADDSWNESDANYAEMMKEEGIKKIKDYADGVGLWVNHALDPVTGKTTGLIEMAKKAGLIVHVYTMRKDSFPKAFKSFRKLHEKLLYEIGADGVFSDFPDLSKSFLKKQK